jgi:hypothetical protein
MPENSVELEKGKNISQIFSPISFHGRQILVMLRLTYVNVLSIITDFEIPQE